MEDEENVSNVDEFLRENGCKISTSVVGVVSRSDDKMIEEELFLSDAEGCQPTSIYSCNNQRRRTHSPRFVLLEDDGLVMAKEETTGRLCMDKTSHKTHDQGQDKGQDKDQDKDQDNRDLLDQLMVVKSSEFSRLNDTPRGNKSEQEMMLLMSPSVFSSSSSSSLRLERQPVDEQDLTPLSLSVYPTMSQQKEIERVEMISATSSVLRSPSSFRSLSHSHASSSVSSERAMDDELNDALGMPGSSNETDKLGLSSKVSREKVVTHKRKTGSDQDRQSQQSTALLTPRTQRALFIDDKKAKRLTEKGVADEDTVRLMQGLRLAPSTLLYKDQRRRFSQPRSEESMSVINEADEKKEDIGVKSNFCAAVKSERNLTCEDVGVIDEGAWSGLNDLLRKNGLSVVRFCNAGSEMIEDLVITSQRNLRARSRLEDELRTIEKKNVELQKTLEKAKAETKRLETLQEKESKSTELLSKKLKSSCRRLQQQLKVSEHRVKAKEIDVEKLQAKLQQQVDRNTSNRMRDRRAFHNLWDREPRRANPRDIHALESISVYEAQREQMNEEIANLKLQVAALNSELRDKDNFIARQARTLLKSDPPVWKQCFDESYSDHELSGTQYGLSSVISDEVMLEQLEAARREQEVAAAKLRHREAVMVKKVAMIEEELLAAREAIGKLNEENAHLLSEMKSRPSIRDYRQSQCRVRQLEQQIAEKKLALEEASDFNELYKSVGTKEHVERDRLNHRLNLNRLNTLPRETAVEIVKHVCRVLHVTDITLIAPSLDKICSVVAAVPRMESFIQEVYGYVFLHLNDNAQTTDISSSSFELEEVILTLRRWAMERKKLHALEDFKTSIITELSRRTVEPGMPNNMEENSSHDESAPCYPTTLSRAIHIVSELVKLEKSIMRHRELYTQAAAGDLLPDWCGSGEVERCPNVLTNQIVRHFLHVFQVKNIEGVLPKINEIYLQVNEIKNFLHASREIFHLRNDTSLVHCLNVIKEKLQVGAVDATHVHAENLSSDDTEGEHAYVGNSPNFVVEKRWSQPSSHGGSSQADLVGVRQVRQMSILVRELKRELGAATMDDILPRTKRLMELLSLSIHDAGPEDDDG
ncbi:unnamed protein product [Peronospora belbahrii]|uniref:Centrosomal protein of 70 kDa n=1 Tax=Peronospora belbahrii TaxID=622444 RepID=A0ABN8D9P0_9STRA|nr:unnamed protein product [Peronospora belbahrii]